MKTMVFLLVFVLALGGIVSVAGASTIQSGEVRTVTGKVSAVDVGARALVMKAPTAKGMLTVGVTMKEGAPVTKDARKVALDDLKYALAVRRATAERYGLKTIADLARVSDSLAMGSDYEFFQRPEWRALERA